MVASGAYADRVCGSGPCRRIGNYLLDVVATYGRKKSDRARIRNVSRGGISCCNPRRRRAIRVRARRGYRALAPAS